MRWVIMLAALSPGVAFAQPDKLDPRAIDKQLFDVLKEVHNRGADIFNAGDPLSCYRMFQGALWTARAALAHRPAEQKFIDNAFAAAGRLSNVSDRAFLLHEAIEKLRLRLIPSKEKLGPERIELLPRVVDPRKKWEAPKEGVHGLIYREGAALVGVEVLFVSRDVQDIRVYESTTDADGRYIIPVVRPGRYTVLLKHPDRKRPLPERYAAATDSPLIAEVKGGGDRLDFMLQ